MYFFLLKFCNHKKVYPNAFPIGSIVVTSSSQKNVTKFRCERSIFSGELVKKSHRSTSALHQLTSAGFCFMVKLSLCLIIIILAFMQYTDNITFVLKRLPRDYYANVLRTCYNVVDCLQSAFSLKMRLVLDLIQRNCKPRCYNIAARVLRFCE